VTGRTFALPWGKFGGALFPLRVKNPSSFHPLFPLWTLPTPGKFERGARDVDPVCPLWMYVVLPFLGKEAPSALFPSSKLFSCSGRNLYRLTRAVFFSPGKRFRFHSFVDPAFPQSPFLSSPPPPISPKKKLTCHIKHRFPPL